MEKNYDHLSTEDKLYASWEASGVMRANNTSKKEPFTIPLPPPNVTGHLHLGHAAMLAIEDIMIRFKKMTGHEVLWVPGTDHAAIATENVVLKHLKIQNREEMTRENFLKECRKFAGEKHDRIVHQIRKMGAHLDWSREAYTFDEARNHAVNTIFKRLYDDGLIVRGHRMINWSVGAQSVLSDDEVQWEDGETIFYEFWCGPFLIGTVRTETKCADSPVVVHPTAKYIRAQNAEGKECIVTEKYFKGHTKLKKDFKIIETVQGKKLVGMEFEAETYAGKRKFWVMADNIIDPDFGTGAMTISTAHDPHDFELAQAHGLDLIQKIDFKGRMTDIAGPCSGMLVKDARKKAGEILEEKNLLFEKRPYANRIPVCYRSGTVVEPMLSPQWFISVDKEFKDQFTGKKTTLKKLMQEAVRDKHVQIIPRQFEKVYFHWIDNLRDWCISRQIWWGHRIPVWYDEKGEIATVGETKDPKSSWTQDPDTLDTWFSSALWPFSTLGWPDENAEDYRKFYPTDVLETGHDILFFWVARMIMFGRYATGVYPFHTVYLHGLVTDEHGKKMSKSAGNGIDPLDVIEKYGADAARLSLVVGTSPGQPIPLGESKISGYRNFVNKLWNAGRFIQMQTVGTSRDLSLPEPKSLADRWIASRFTHVAKEVAKHLEKYEISLAGDKIYHFVWDEFCNWYIEESKKEKNPVFLKHIFGEILKLSHPLCPFITEKLWEELEFAPLCKGRCPKDRGVLEREFLVLQNFPTPTFKDKKAEEEFQKMQAETIRVRQAQADKQADKKEKARLEQAIFALEARLKNKGYTDKAPAHLVEQTKKELEEAKEKLKKM
ncbi:class I tRNA ligase family protein [Candidatus Gracilibacteria bacterium]|nr:class I tRNA ligase family protein [Candidatus Gracilibacteria bacterium]